jgi:soluble P-type ATPase
MTPRSCALCCCVLQGVGRRRPGFSEAAECEILAREGAGQMLDVEVPGFRRLKLENLVLDYNGTLAQDGELVPGVAERLEALSGKLAICVLTADTFGKAREGLEGIPCELIVLPAGDQAARKLRHVEKLGADTTVCVGNGKNDALMLGMAALGIAVVLEEGAARETIESADILCNSVTSALDLLLNPMRLVATLRS